MLTIYMFDSMGKPGNGFYSINDNQIVITDPCATIGPIYLPDTINPMFGMNVRYKPGSNPNGTPINAKFDFKQFKLNGELVGSTSYGVHSVLNGSGQQGGGQGTPDIEETKRTDNLTATLTVNPNPALQATLIEYQSAPNAKVTIVLYNSLGKLVKQLYEGDTDEAGKIKTMLEVANLSAGTYFVQTNQSGMKLYQKIVVMK